MHTQGEKAEKRMVLQNVLSLECRFISILMFSWIPWLPIIKIIVKFLLQNELKIGKNHLIIYFYFIDYS